MGSGTTNEWGQAAISLPQEDLPKTHKSRRLMPPGLYTVRITHSSIKLSSRFNTETQIDCEVSVEAGNPACPIWFQVSGKKNSSFKPSRHLHRPQPLVALSLSLLFLANLSLAITPANHARAVTAAPAEIAERDRWLLAGFPPLAASLGAPTAAPGLVVVEGGSAWFDRVQQNGAFGQLLRVGRTRFERGLFCHAPSKIIVRVGRAARSFTAQCGINSQFADSRGSVQFTVTVGGQERYRSPTIRKRSEPAACQVDLEGATQFEVSVGSADGGIVGDHAIWADARIELAGGDSLWLSDLPILAGQSADVSYQTQVPFSFVYGDQPVRPQLAKWTQLQSHRRLDGGRDEYTITYTDPQTGLEARCVVIRFRDFPTVEWTLYLKNTGSENTPVVSELQSLDISLESRAGVAPPFNEFVLHRIRGDTTSPTAFEPLDQVLRPNDSLRLAPRGGRPTGLEAPYFNLEWVGGGAIVVVGWPGQWEATFSRNGATGLDLRTGQQQTHFVLHPGEEIRTPRIVMQFWKGERTRAQNIWRRWMKAHNMPRPGGALPDPLLLVSSHRVTNEMVDADEANQLQFLRRSYEEQLPIDCYWMDAGWYPCDGTWGKTGTWQVDLERFPRGFRPISDLAHSQNTDVLVWFEPERVTPGSWLANEHAAWLLGDAEIAHGRLLNLGDPEARSWLTHYIDKFMKAQGIDHYRQDFNFDPLGHWRANDASDRLGITEIRHVTGYLEHFDELLLRDRDRLIDTCASGGQRCDIDTLKRAVPLWRSDYLYEPVGMQCITYGLSSWIPYHGTGTVAHEPVGHVSTDEEPIDPYVFWSNALLSVNCGLNLRKRETDYVELRRLFGQWRRLAPNLLGDFYPLTPYSQENWMVWQFDRPEVGLGMVQAFRREVGIYESVRLQLRNLDVAAQYRLKYTESGQTRLMSGKELMQSGLVIEAAGLPGVVVIAYEKVQ